MTPAARVPSGAPARPAAPALPWAWTGAGLLWLALLLVPPATAWTRSPDLAHGWAAPLLMLYLWWERLPRSAPRPPAARHDGAQLLGTLALALIAAVTRLMLEPFPLWTPALIFHGAAVFALGGLLVWRRAGRIWAAWLLRPAIVLAGALPWPAPVNDVFIQPLRKGLAIVSAELIGFFSQPAMSQGTSVRLANGWVGIDEACGGIRSLQAAVMIALFFGELGRFGAARRLGLVAAAVAAALAGNFARILYLASAATGGMEKIHAAHDTAGWIALSLTLAGVGAASWLLYPRTKAALPAAVAPQATTPPPAGRAPRLAWCLAPLAVLGLGEAGTRLWFDSGEAGQAYVTRWEAKLPETRANFYPEPLGKTGRELLQPDDYHAGRWRDSTGERVAAYATEWRSGQLARTLPFLHNPTICLPASGCELLEARGERVFHLGDLALPFRSYLFTRTGEDFLVSFIVWDPARGEPLVQPDDASETMDRLTLRWAEVRERRRHQPAQMLCVAVYGPNAETRTLQLLETIVRPK